MGAERAGAPRKVVQSSTGTEASVTASWARQVSLVSGETNR
jgi:hypothetical protein